MFSFTPTDEQKALQQEIKAFAAAHLSGGEELRDRSQQFDRQWWAAAGQIRLPGLAIPETYGGRGLDPLSTLLALEALGYGCKDNGLNFAISAHLLACVVPLWLYGSEELKETYLPGLCNGELIAANAMSEPSSGSDAFQMRTLAVEEASGFRISGAKSFVSNGPVADGVLLYAATDPERGYLGGITAFWLDRRIHDYKTGAPWNKMGLRSCPLGELFFDNMNVDKSFLVGRLGRGAMIFNRSMEWERVCLGGCHLGNMQRLLEMATQLVRDQIAGGAPRHERQAISYALAEMQARLESARLMAYSAAWKMGQGKSVSREAAMAKLSISELYKKMTLMIAGLFGAAGHPNGEAERSQRDAMSSTIYSGTSEMQKNIIAQSMGL
ncbi:MAG: acyl-CoA dehydrogenase family protein [Phaeodactylibacter sp.]|nr:acyl-CoA dehydrogenase family protein [Phaeodactylibacter sp.]MCB9301020.1 acyl-CoA dehydrogenase family protein [Lewinellaceae bacterium]